jgi:hypothetical protein
MTGMRANTQFEHQLAFDRVAEEYDDARPLFGVFRQSPDFAGDERSQLTALRESAADGRQELISSGVFGMPWWQWRTDHFDIDADRYIRLLSSYANIALLDPGARNQFGESVGRELAAMHVSQVPITNHIYAVVARVKDRGR